MTLESSDLGDLQVDFSWQPREAVEDYVRRLPEDRVGWTVGWATAMRWVQEHKITTLASETGISWKKDEKRMGVYQFIC